MKRALVAALVAFGCQPDANLTPDAAILERPCSLDTRVGGFIVDEQPAPMFPTVTGNVADAVLPLANLQEVHAEGDCVLLRRVNPFCDPACPSGTLCDHDMTCVPYPTNQDVGDVTITGLNEAVTMSPDATNYYYDTELVSPIFGEGAPIHLDAEGSGAVPGFALDGAGVAPMILATNEVSIATSTPLEVSWVRGGEPDARVVVDINIDQHGNSPVKVVCDFEDDGAGTIPAAVIDALFSFGVSGFPNGVAARRTVTSTFLPLGCVDLVVHQRRILDVSVEGHTPCGPGVPCPDPLVCDFPTGTCM